MNLRTLLAYAALCAIWGTTWLGIKVGLQSLPPMTGAGIRFLVGGVFLWLLGRVVRVPRGEWAPWRTILILATTFCGANYALTYYSETGLASGLVAVLFGTLPFFLFGFGALLLREPVGAAAIGGAALAFAGVATISLSADTHGSLQFVCAALGAAALSAFGVVELKRSAASDPFRTLPPAMLLGGAGLTLAGALLERPDYARGASLPSVGAILYLAVLGSGIAFYLNHWLLQRLTAWQVGLSSLVVPVIAVVVGAFFGGESFGWKELGGAALVIAGVRIALRSPRAAVAFPEP